MKRILITGGAGFIGSHTSYKLLEDNYELLIIDSLINSTYKSLERLKEIFKQKNIDINCKLNFFEGDLKDKKFVDSVFKSSINEGKPIDGVIHFAGLKAVAESVINPVKYWENNVLGSFNLIQSMDDNNCKTIVFSSSATVYGNTSEKLISEKSKINPINPYGSTKFAVENLLNDIYQKKSGGWKIAILRYFNPIGAHPSGLIGENPLQKPNNIFPIIINAAYEKVKLKVFGDDWPSHDGTCIRDYIHVVDLAEGHLKALDYLFKNESQLIKLNLGTGCGYSVLDLIKTFEKVNSVKVPFEISKRREGDVFKLIANNEKAVKTIDWFPNRSLEDMCRDGWNWKIKNPMGFQNN